MAASVNLSQNPPMVIDTSSPYPHVRQEKEWDGFHHFFGTVFSPSEEDVNRLAELCRDKLREAQAGPQDLNEVLHIHRCLCQLCRESAAQQGKVSSVAATVFDTLHKTLRTDAKDTRDQVFQSYGSSVITDLYKPVFGLLDENQTKALCKHIQRGLPAPLESLNSEDWDMPLDKVFASILRAANELYDLYPEQAKECVEYVNQTLAEIHHWESLEALTPEQKEEAQKNLPSPVCILLRLLALAMEIDATMDPQWEIKFRAVLSATSKLYQPFQEKALIGGYITELCQNPQFPGFAESETIDLIRSMYPNFTWLSDPSKLMNTQISHVKEEIVKNLELAFTTGNRELQKACVKQLLEMRSKSGYIPYSVSTLIAHCIGQGRISLKTIVEIEGGQFLLNNIVKSYKNIMGSLIKTLGDKAKEFFKVYGICRLTLVYDFLISKDLTSSLCVLKDYIEQVPPEFRTVKIYGHLLQGNDIEKWPGHFEKFMNHYFARPVILSEFMKFGQLCYWAKKVFTLPMVPQKLSDATFNSIVQQIEGRQMLVSGGLQSLDGTGYEDPLALIQAVPLDEVQKTYLLQVYNQSAR